MEVLEFDLPSALLTQMVALFDSMVSENLVQEKLDEIPEEQGVYQIFLDGKLVYVGKTDSDAGLKKRISRHCEKIKNRTGLQAGMVQFKAVRIYVFTAMDLETQLINFYKNKLGTVEWQNSGFGSNDPGRKRDSGKPGFFDSTFPINIDIPFESISHAGPISVFDLLNRLKQVVPYVVRFEREKNGADTPSELSVSTISLHKGMDTPRKLLQEVKRVLSKDWQITVLPGYVIIYKENNKYTSSQVL
jgi:Uri superfamily endonuclease